MATEPMARDQPSALKAVHVHLQHLNLRPQFVALLPQPPTLLPIHSLLVAELLPYVGEFFA